MARGRYPRRGARYLMILDLPKTLTSAIDELTAASYQMGHLDARDVSQAQAKEDEERAREGLELAVVTWASARAEEAVRRERERTGSECWLSRQRIGDCVIRPARGPASKQEQATVLAATEVEP